jgi:Cu(I)/Ag(I) efflux system membrane protein CusA/SilA
MSVRRWVENNGLEFFIRGKGFVKDQRDIERIVIRQKAGTPIFVKNVATVQRGPEFGRGVLDNSGREAVGAVVLMRYGETQRDVIRRLQARIAEIEPGLQIRRASGNVVSVRILPYYDRTDIIHETMATLRDNLTEETVVVALIVVLLRLHLRSSLAILPTLPHALAMNFIAMFWLGVDSNIMSLVGIAISIGDVSDMGLNMTENIYRRLASERDRPHGEVVSEAATEVGGAIFTAVINTIVSFIPVFALTGPDGKMFQPLAHTTTFAIAASVILAITIVPVPSHHLLKPVVWYGVNIRDIQDAIKIAIGGDKLTTTVEQRERYPIFLDTGHGSGCHATNDHPQQRRHVRRADHSVRDPLLLLPCEGAAACRASA